MKGVHVMSIMIGSARIDENGKASGGAAGDQKQKSSTNDTVGEVSMQAMYTHSKGWYILRLKDTAQAAVLACKMITACNNANIGYDQNQRTGILTYGVDTKVKTEADCGTLVRQCLKEATGVDVGNFTTANEKSVLVATELFETPTTYVSQEKTPVYNGDILVTKTKGHTAIVVSGNPRTDASAVYYSKYTGTSVSIVTALKAVGETDTSLTHRKKIATANSISGYTGTAAQNTKMLTLLKYGKLVKA
jgi:hypothetical protein